MSMDREVCGNCMAAIIDGACDCTTASERFVPSPDNWGYYCAYCGCLSAQYESCCSKCGKCCECEPNKHDQVKWLSDRLSAAEAKADKAMAILRDCCNATPGCFCAPEVSLEFLSGLPVEIRMQAKAAESRLAAAEARAAEAESLMWAKVQDKVEMRQEINRYRSSLREIDDNSECLRARKIARAALDGETGE